MFRNRFLLYAGAFTLAISACTSADEPRECENPETEYAYQSMTDSLKNNLKWPEDLELSVFTDAELVPSPACMAVSAQGDVFAGVDMIGSLGKEMGKGAIVKLVDCNADGILDSHTVFAEIDNPRGILAIGDQVFVLHTRFNKDTGKAENMDLVVFEDKDGDGVADGEPKVLLKDVSNSKYIQERGTDHATNGIQMGIDGWIYIAAGDFGFHNATAADGTVLTMLGGGILRIRPDGSEFEVYTHGLRNVYDVAIDPFMNIYTRDNTNDGGGWNIRFSHQIQSAEFGYPTLFKNFTEEIIPALVDAGGGSGTGAYFLNDSRWPEKYNNIPLMADWGRSYLYTHKVTEDGPTFTQKDEEFIQLPQITDLDIDAGGVLYLSAWDGAGYSGSPDRGYIVRAVPKDFKYANPTHNIQNKSDKKVVALLKSKEAKTRLEAQYTLLSRDVSSSVIKSVLKLANNGSESIESRIAALYTYAQLSGKDGIDNLVKATQDKDLREQAIRLLGDRKAWAGDIPLEPLLEGLESDDQRIKVASLVALGRTDKKEAANKILKIKVPASFKAPALGTEGPHATPNSEIVLPHIAVRTLLALDANDEAIAALGTENEELALWAMRYMHDPKVVKALIDYYPKADAQVQQKVLHTLARIYHIEDDYDTSWWWGTIPDTHGPYYKGVKWEASEKIEDFFKELNKEASSDLFKILNTKYRLAIEDLGTIDLEKVVEEDLDVDLEAITSEKGEVGRTSIEDILLALQKIEGDEKEGAALFDKQGCRVCHSTSTDEPNKGPFMGQIGSIMNREQIAESILKPNASISQGFSTVQVKTKDGKTYIGFVTSSSADKITMRNVAGVSTDIPTEDIEERTTLEYSMMPEGLANSLTLEEFASLIAYLESHK